MTFYERVKEIREMRGFTSKFVAQHIGVAPSTYSQYESGSREPDVMKIKAIAEVLQVSADYLLFGKDNPFDIDADGIKLYKALDTEDKAEIRGEMKQMLKSDKYKLQSTLEQLQEDMISEAVKQLNNVKSSV